MYCTICLKIKRLLANFSKASSELIFVLSKFIKKKFAVGSFATILFFSKIYGLAGLRLGWGYCSKEIIDAMYQIKPPFNVNRAALAAGVEAIKDNEWTKRAIEHNTLWAKKIFSILEENKIVANEPTANFFLINFDKTKINSDEAFEKLANKRLILRKMVQYKIPNSLRLTIGNKQANEHFIQAIGSIIK